MHQVKVVCLPADLRSNSQAAVGLLQVELVRHISRRRLCEFIKSGFLHVQTNMLILSLIGLFYNHTQTHALCSDYLTPPV
jgi:hypothetical membrane protein